MSTKVVSTVKEKLNNKILTPSKIKIKRSIVNTPILSLDSGEMALHLGGSNQETMLFIGNIANQPILINQLPLRFSFNKSYLSPIIVPDVTSYNIFTDIVASDVSSAPTTNFNYVSKGFSYSSINKSLIFPPFKSYVTYSLRVQLQGMIGGASGTDRQFKMELRRGGDNSLLFQEYVMRLNGVDMAGFIRNYNTFTNGIEDPFITGGLRVVLYNDSGTTITLTGFSLLIQGICTNFIQ